MGRPARKFEANESVESRVVNAVKYAFGAPEVKIIRGETLSRISIALGMLDGCEVWLDLACAIRSEEIPVLHDEEDS